MKKGRNRAIWAACLIIIGIAALVQFGLGLAGVELPDAAVRILGALYLLALPALGFTTVRLFIDNGERGHGNGDK